MSSSVRGGHRPRPAREEVRRRVLDAAARVFAERGFAGASLDQVAAAAGFTKGAVYSNFAGKDDLFLALLTEQVLARVEAADRLLAEHQGPPDELVRLVGRQLSRQLVEHDEWQLLFLEFWQRAVRDPELAQRFTAERRRLRAPISAVFARQAERLGVDVPLPPEQLATVVLALLNGLFIERRADPSAVPDELFGQVLGLVVAPAGVDEPGPPGTVRARR